ncbi:MAG: PepSY-like domain-containing protein [Cytophagaceae bacterium]|nr:PepSY-like domain-containing protein [Cytophagaceae bacterium]MDW8455534.1 PepSY-like domain-containing protein [Cytophagaceae bacterium]
MKKLVAIISMMYCGIQLTSAQDIDIPAKDVPKPVMAKFKSMFPKAEVEEWDKFDTFYEVTFMLNGVEKEALFSPQGDWLITEHIVKYSQLPEKVKQGFAKTEYKDWKVKAAAEVEMPEYPKAYGIDVAKGKSEYALYFDAEGNFIKKTED